MSDFKDESEEIVVEKEVDDIPYVEFDISVSPADPTIEVLVSQIGNGDIIIPFYQRKYVWDIEQASRLIESFIMGLPVPQIFLYVNDDGLLEVIDGQQRLMSIKYFIEGFFGEAKNNKRQIFKLKGLSEASALNNRTYSELEPRDQRKIRNSTLRAIQIKQLSPSKRNDCVFHIFQRLNTGGTQLKPQEIRNAVYRGDIVKEFGKLNSDLNWLKVLGLKKNEKHQRDMEFILRIFSLFDSWQDYEKPMVNFLNNAMKNNKSFNTKKCYDFQNNFPLVVEFLARELGKSFRPRGVLNLAVMDSVMVTLLTDIKYLNGSFKANYDELMLDEDYIVATSISTADAINVKARFKLASEYLSRA